MNLLFDADEVRRRYAAAFSYMCNIVSYEQLTSESWLARCENAQERGDLPSALALIHHRVVPITEQRWRTLRGPRFDFVYRASYQRCMADQVWGYNCPLTDETLELDHAWPYSLGGRSVSDNAVWLCSYHNRAKSFDVHCYHWIGGRIPEWLSTMLRSIERDVRSGRFSRFV